MQDLGETEADVIVALRKESVDRNGLDWSVLDGPIEVALRKESVDRNFPSSPSRGACFVALRKESVDRNNIRDSTPALPSSRSPQGERG